MSERTPYYQDDSVIISDDERNRLRSAAASGFYFSPQEVVRILDALDEVEEQPKECRRMTGDGGQ